MTMLGRSPCTHSLGSGANLGDTQGKSALHDGSVRAAPMPMPPWGTRAPGARIASAPLLGCLLSARLSQGSDVRFDKNPRSELFVLQQSMSKGSKTLAAPSSVPSSSSSSSSSSSRILLQQGWDLLGGCDL